MSTEAPEAPGGIRCGSPVNSKKHHLFHGEDERSLCGKWLFFGEKYVTDIVSFGKGRDDCKACGDRARKHLGVDIRTMRLETAKVTVDEVRKLAWACSKLHAAITLGLNAEKNSPVYNEATAALKPFEKELARMRQRVFEEEKAKQEAKNHFEGATT